MATLFLSVLPKFHPSLNFQTKITIHSCQSKINHKKIISTTTRGIRSKHYSSHERIFKVLDDFICKFIINTSLSPHVDPKHELSGNFYPVEELPPTACQVVEGSLPPTLEGGAYIQNGPNPQFIPRGPYYIADGDGMLHSIKFSGGGKAIFCSRFVKTHKYIMERDLGYPFFPNPVAYFISNSVRFILLTLARFIIGGKINPLTTGIGTANTSVFEFAGRLFAMIESDLPYAIKISPDGDIITIGRHDFHSSDNDLFLNMTAHPKVDAGTGEAFAFRYNVIPPFLTFFRIDPNGRKQKDVSIFSIKGVTSYMHDFAVTKRFAVFLDAQLVIDPLGIMRGKKILRVDPEKTPRLGVIPRYATDDSEMYWTDVPGLNMMHVINAWEDDDDATCNKIVMVVTNILPVEINLLERRSSTHLSLEKITIDTKTKEVVRCIVSTRSIDFGAINPKYAGKKNRYMYAAAIENYPKMVGVVKLDLSLCEEYSGDSAVVASRIYGPGCYGSEPIFVAREANNPTAEEDDGYLLVYVHDENTKESKFIVMNAKSPSLEVIAAVKLPGRVPHGFHTTFVSKVDLLIP
ncbi:hypothetical protein ABFS82_01G101300 [Erythranthe guttata]|uniref:Carotenoid cleavage dioxygenase 4 n=2 Tax=Erythranthe guttata TaxID=4155 RepID=A0A022PUQ6_ERYGU|nr:hypothetical protein MIMGU_mgv1a003604mg [Erythranthe guttata]